MISIVTAYYNRKQLFINTLNSIKNQNFKGEFEVIAVDDGSSEDERLEDLQKIYPFLKVIYLDPRNKWYKNSCIPFNIGFSAAKGDKIIIQNPECLHLDEILRYVEKYLTEGNYISFAAFSLDKATTERAKEIFSNRHLIDDIIKKHDICFKMDGELGWYNHSEHRPSFYHFCSCITKKDLFELGGFDERYALGIGGDDLEFVYRIQKKGMLLKIDDNIVVLHQNHYTHNITFDEMLTQKRIEYKKNKDLFENVTKSLHKWKVNYLGISTPNTHETQIKIDYQLLLESKISQVIQYRFARKLTAILLNVISKIKF